MQQTLSLLTIYQVPSLTKQNKQIDARGISQITENAEWRLHRH